MCATPRTGACVCVTALMGRPDSMMDGVVKRGRRERPRAHDHSFDNPLDVPTWRRKDGRSVTIRPSLTAEGRRNLFSRIPHIKLCTVDHSSGQKIDDPGQEPPPPSAATGRQDHDVRTLHKKRPSLVGFGRTLATCAQLFDVEKAKIEVLAALGGFRGGPGQGS